MLEFFKRSWLVLAGALVFGLLLAFTYTSWEPLIEANRIAKLQRGIRSILPQAATIEADTLATASDLRAEPQVVYRGLNAAGDPVGFVFRAEGTGFQDRIELLVGLDARLERYRGIAVLFAQETPGFGDAIRDSVIFKQQFIGAPAAEDLIVVKGPDEDRPKTDDNEIVSITGATITSEAVTTIINRRFDEIRPTLERMASGRTR